MNMKDPTSRLAHWNLSLQDYDFDIIHKPGTQQTHVDCLSDGKINEYGRIHRERITRANIQSI